MASLNASELHKLPTDQFTPDILYRLLPDMPMSNDFAIALGLKESTQGTDIPPGREHWRSRIVSIYIRRLTLEVELQQEVIWSRFCALYLPALVDRFLDPIPATDNGPTGLYPNKSDLEDFELQNAWHSMLTMIHHNPYFSKYMKSKEPIATKGNQNLTRVLVERLLKLAKKWDPVICGPASAMQHSYELTAGNAVQLLSTLCTTFVNHPDPESILPLSMKRDLVPYLVKWRNQFLPKEALLGNVCMRTVFQLTLSKENAPDLHREILVVQKRNSGWETCAFPPCLLDRGDDGKMKTCGRCKTTRYCSAEHQRAHWKTFISHKEYCHTTAY